jgi:hypothetical protein
MATPTSSAQLSLGSRDGVVAQFTALANNDTWETGMSVIDHVAITGDNSGNETFGYTASGGTVTFKASAQLDNVSVLVIGYK